MATLKIVPKEHWEIVREYIFDDNAVILVPQENLNDFPEEKAKMLLEGNEECIDYDFGSEPDIVVDVLSSPNSFCANTVLELLAQEHDEY